MCVELLVIGNECSVLLLLFSRLNMDQLSFIFSLLLIVSAATTSFGSAIKANNPNEEVKKESTYVMAFDKLSVCKLKWRLLKFAYSSFGPFYAMNELLLLTRCF